MIRFIALIWIGIVHAISLRGSHGTLSQAPTGKAAMHVHEDLKPFLGTWNVLYTNTGNKKSPNCENIYYYIDDSLQFRYFHSKMIENNWHEHKGYIHLDSLEGTQLNTKGNWKISEKDHHQDTFSQRILYMDSDRRFMVTSDEKQEKFHILTRPSQLKRYTQSDGITELNTILRNSGIVKLEDFHQENHSFCYP